MGFLKKLFGPPDIEKLKAEGDLDGLARALSNEKDAIIREKAARALGAIGDVLPLMALTAAKNDVDAKVRQAADQAIQSIRRGLGNTTVFLGGRPIKLSIESIEYPEGDSWVKLPLSALLGIGITSGEDPEQYYVSIYAQSPDEVGYRRVDFFRYAKYWVYPSDEVQEKCSVSWGRVCTIYLFRELVSFHYTQRLTSGLTVAAPPRVSVFIKERLHRKIFFKTDGKSIVFSGMRRKGLLSFELKVLHIPLGHVRGVVKVIHTINGVFNYMDLGLLVEPGEDLEPRYDFMMSQYSEKDCMKIADYFNYANCLFSKSSLQEDTLRDWDESKEKR